MCGVLGTRRKCFLERLPRRPAFESAGGELAAASKGRRPAYRGVPMHREKASLGVCRARLGNEYDGHDPPDLSSRDFFYDPVRRTANRLKRTCVQEAGVSFGVLQ